MKTVTSAGLVPTSARSLPGFVLLQPRDLDEALDAIARHPDSVLLAGGTDLVAQYNEGLAPAAVIDLSRVDALRRIALDDGVLRIGALVTHHAGSTHATVRQALPGFADAWSRIANPRIRFRATLGGNLMARRTRYEASVLLTALEARVHLAGAGGKAELDAPSLWSRAAGAPPALLTAVSIDTRETLAFHYERSMRPLMTQAVAVQRHDEGLRLSLAIATEYLRPVHLALRLDGLRTTDLAAQAARIAHDLFEQLPGSFEDAVVTRTYAGRAGRVLLRRQLENLHV